MVTDNNPAHAGVLLVSAAQTAASGLGVCEGFSFEQSVEVVEIPGEGDLGPTALGIYRKSVAAIVDFLVKGVIPVGTLNSLVFTSKDSAGNTVTDTIRNMMALGYSKDFQKKAPAGKYRQLFRIQDAMATDPIS